MELRSGEKLQVDKSGPALTVIADSQDRISPKKKLGI